MKVLRDGKLVEIAHSGEFTDEEREKWLAEWQEEINEIEDPKIRARWQAAYDFAVEMELKGSVMCFRTDADREADRQAELEEPWLGYSGPYFKITHEERLSVLNRLFACLAKLPPEDHEEAEEIFIYLESSGVFDGTGVIEAMEEEEGQDEYGEVKKKKKETSPKELIKSDQGPQSIN